MEINLIKRKDFDLDINEDIEEIYLCSNNNENIGYGYFLNNSIYIYINPEYRGNGYGKELFNNLLSKTNQELNFKVETTNIPMIKILVDNNAILVSTRDGIENYILKNSNN